MSVSVTIISAILYSRVRVLILKLMFINMSFNKKYVQQAHGYTVKVIDKNVVVLSTW